MTCRLGELRPVTHQISVPWPVTQKCSGGLYLSTPPQLIVCPMLTSFQESSEMCCREIRGPMNFRSLFVFAAMPVVLLNSGCGSSSSQPGSLGEIRKNVSVPCLASQFRHHRRVP